MQRLNRGFSKDTLQTIFGHADKKSTEKYCQYLTGSLSATMSGKTPRDANVTQINEASGNGL
jgi:hypothetical protein